MDFTDRFLNNRALLQIVRNGILMLLADAAFCLLPAKYGAAQLAQQNAANLYIAPNAFRLLYVLIFGVSAACILISTVFAYRHTDRVYRDLDSMYADCLAVADAGASQITPCGSETGSVRRLCEGIQRVANRTAHHIRQLDQQKKLHQELLADISHQIKTALAVVRLNRDMLAELPLPQSERQRLSGEITAQLDSVETLVLETLKLAKLDANAVSYTYSETDLAETCRLAAARIQPLSDAKEIEISVSSGDTPLPAFPHDRVWLCEGVCNLLKNAVDHAACRHISISLTAMPDAIRFCLSDDGAGIPAAEIPHLFDRFRGKTADMRNTGLGMAIAKRIFAAHGAQITVYSGDGGTELLAFLHAVYN